MSKEVCKGCGTEFNCYPSRNRKYCSVSCFNKWKKENCNVVLVCENCGKKYKKIKALQSTSKFCSKECKDESKRIPLPKCLDCGKELSKRGYTYCGNCRSKGDRNWIWKGGDITVNCDYCNKLFKKQRTQYNRSNNHFCCKLCEANWKSENLSGENSHSWKGGLTELRYLIRGTRNYRFWRKSCFERENYTCEICNIRGGYLEVHHIKPFSLILKEYNIKSAEESKMCEELWDVNNGQVLCKECHDSITRGDL